MTRVKRVSYKKHKKTFKIVKSFRGAGSRLFRTAMQQKMKALRSAYTNRRKKKRNFRSLWISRIHAVVRNYGMNYNEFIQCMKKSSFLLNRKILAQVSICDPEVFSKLVVLVKN